MTIRTNISVSTFNILRYLLLGIVVDYIVRRSLDSFEHFRRRLTLHRGHSVCVAGRRIDRYNTLRVLMSGRFLQGSVLVLATALAYAAELALEYAVDSSAIRYAIAANVTRVQQRAGVCTRDEMISTGTILDIAFMADQCVILEDNVYRLYRPVWVASASASDRVNDDGLRVLCEAVEDNLMYEGEALYGTSTTSKASPEVLQLIHTLSANSHRTIGDIWLPLLVLNVSSSDVRDTASFATPLEQFSLSFFYTNISGSSVQCIGFVGGTKRQNALMVQLVGCVDGFDEQSSLVLTYGTSFVEVASDDGAAGASAEWNTPVAFEIRTRIPRYFERIRVHGRSSRANAEGFSWFMARSLPQDVINLNKYAIVYRFCDEIPLAVRNGTSWEAEFEFASSEVRVTATVEEWAIALAVCWVVVVTLAHLLVTRVAAWKNMPDNVFGEQDILRRWAEENNAKQKEEGMVPVLLVEGGVNGGRITANLRHV